MNETTNARQIHQIQLFGFENHDIRVSKDENGDPWFIANDVCKALEIQSPRDAVSKLDPDQRGTILTDSLGGMQTTSTISESGLYSLIMSSRKPAARAFRRWVTSEVLPSLRKTGEYSTQGLTIPELILKSAQQLVEHDKRLGDLESRVTAQEQKLLAATNGNSPNNAISKGRSINGRVYYTIMGYISAYGGQPIDITTAQELGRKAVYRCTAQRLKIEKTHDDRYGTVNMYPETVLQELIQIKAK